MWTVVKKASSETGEFYCLSFIGNASRTTPLSLIVGKHVFAYRFICTLLGMLYFSVILCVNNLHWLRYHNSFMSVIYYFTILFGQFFTTWAIIWKIATKQRVNVKYFTRLWPLRAETCCKRI